MLHPELLSSGIRRAGAGNELDPLRLFDITWRKRDGGICHIVLPREMTGVAANIVVMTGCGFPSGSHKVGAAYCTLMEGELTGEIEPGVHTIIGPSTGNFGIGTAYVARLKGYRATVVMPEGMSKERYERIRQYGAALDLTPGSESDVILVLERTREYRKDPRNKILAQFELLPNYRFHRYVTGHSALEAAQAYGNGRIAAFVCAPGSAGTLAAGDEIKAHFPECAVCALEPKECSTLFNNGRGTHRIEGIGDKMVTLIHNVLTTDYVSVIHDEDCLTGLELIEQELLPGGPAGLKGLFGVSGVCNILGAIRMARHLDLGPDDNVVTIATDGFDRYPSVLADREERCGRIADGAFEQVFRGGDAGDVLDVRPRSEKQRLLGYKAEMWTGFGYSESYLARMETQSFWEAEAASIAEIDERMELARKRD
jgi:cysteine synthase